MNKQQIEDWIEQHKRREHVGGSTSYDGYVFDESTLRELLKTHDIVPIKPTGETQ